MFDAKRRMFRRMLRARVVAFGIVLAVLVVLIIFLVLSVLAVFAPVHVLF